VVRALVGGLERLAAGLALVRRVRRVLQEVRNGLSGEYHEFWPSFKMSAFLISEMSTSICNKLCFKSHSSSLFKSIFRGRCCDHYFQPFLLFFSEKILALFSKTNVLSIFE
jgi:hypothetical protein